MFDFASKYPQGLSYHDFLARHGTEEHRRRWNTVYERVQLAPVQREILSGFVRSMKVLCLAGAWCGDCVNQCPIFQRFAEAAPSDGSAGASPSLAATPSLAVAPSLKASQLTAVGPRLAVRYFDRDAHADLQAALRICGGSRVPVVVFLSEDDQFLGLYGDRTLAKYQQMAVDQLGPSCPTGIAPPHQALLDAVTQEWLNEFERVQLMLRLSARLRQVHGD